MCRCRLRSLVISVVIAIFNIEPTDTDRAQRPRRRPEFRGTCAAEPPYSMFAVGTAGHLIYVSTP
jgi:hypothetical protein